MRSSSPGPSRAPLQSSATPDKSRKVPDESMSPGRSCPASPKRTIFIGYSAPSTLYTRAGSPHVQARRYNVPLRGTGGFSINESHARRAFLPYTSVRSVRMTDAIRSVKRALRLLRLMNTRSAWTLADLVRELQLPKTSVFRMLRTLEEEGFVRSPPGTHGLYRICRSVQDLASGITSESVLADLAAPIVIAGTKRLRWPLSVAVLDDCYMRVVFCGMPYSRLATRTTTVNRRYWM